MRVILLAIGIFAAMKLATATPLPPDLTVPCDGYQYDSHCLPGTIIFFLWEPPYGFVPQTQQLPYTLWSQPVAPAVEAPVPIPVPEVASVPAVAAAPEPSALGLLCVGLGLIAWRRR